MKKAVPIAVRVRIPTDYFEKDCRLRECTIEAEPDEAVLGSLFGHHGDMWVKMLIRVSCDVQIAVDDELRGLAMEKALERTIHEEGF
jgi:hypothetical protein